MLSSRIRRRGRRAAAVSAVVLAGVAVAMPARSADPDLATVHAHIVGLVGTTDALVLLDRALVSVT